MLGSTAGVKGSSEYTSRWWKYWRVSNGCGWTVMGTSARGTVTRTPFWR